MKEPLVSLIVARAENGVIGRNGDLPWHISADMRHFKALTLGKPVVMGSKTYASIGMALPGRRTIVISRRPDFSAPGCIVVRSLGEALAAAGDVPEVMVAGGAKIYALALPLAHRIYLTEVHAQPEGEVHFPHIGNEWEETERDDRSAEGESPAFSFVTLERPAHHD